MTGKITAAVVAAILLGSAGVASAQIGRTGPTYDPYYSPYYNSYYNTRSRTNSIWSVIVPTDGTRAASSGTGDFGTSPIFGQLSDKPLLASS